MVELLSIDWECVLHHQKQSMCGTVRCGSLVPLHLLDLADELAVPKLHRHEGPGKQGLPQQGHHKHLHIALFLFEALKQVLSQTSFNDP